jgi:hypothetical protein
MSATAEDVIAAAVDPDWIGVAAGLVADFSADASPRERIGLLFSALHAHLGTTDWIACAAIHSRLSALGHMDRSVRLADLHPEGANPDAAALRHAVATAPLCVDGEHLVFDPVDFQRCFAAARHAGAPSPRPRPGQRSRTPQDTAAADERQRLAKSLDKRVKALRLAGLDGVDLVAAMADRMSDLKRLMDAARLCELDRLAARFPALGHYAALLTAIAAAICDGTIEVPR